MINANLIILTYGAFLSAALVDLITVVAISTILKVGVREVGLFWVPRLTTFHLQGISVRLGLFPFPSSYVQFTSGEQEPEDNFQRRNFAELPVFTKLIISLSGIFSNIAIASVVMGFQAFSSTLAGIPQVIKLLISQESGLHYLAQILLLQQNEGWRITWATLTTKVIALNLLPLPGLYGGFILVNLFETLTQTKVSPERQGLITLSFMVIILIMFISNWGEFILSLFSTAK